MKLLPALRQKKRYVVFEILADDSFSFLDIKEPVEGAMKEFWGQLGLSKAVPMLLKEKFSNKKQRFIVKVNNKYVDELISAIILIKKIKNTPVIIKSVITSGILKKAGAYLDKNWGGVQMNKQLVDKMGYDRSITMFSPDGRLLQVEYAKKTVKQGSTAIGLACKDGIVLISDKRVTSKLMVPDTIEKTFRIDDHIATTASGIISDARVLVDRAQLKAQQHAVTYDSMIDVISVVKDICDLKQICTQSAGLRPFGVSMLVGGVENDGSIKLFLTEPYGLYFQYKAAVIGEGEPEIEPELQKKYKPTLGIDEGVQLGLSLLKGFLKTDFNYDRIDAVQIAVSDKRFKKLTVDEMKKLMK